MQYGIYVPNYGADMSARAFADLAAAAEEAGWDGFFIWDHILAHLKSRAPMVDPIVTLAAMALCTNRIRLGTAVTPLPRRRPWKLAREMATLDHLSNGRVILGVGIGFPPDAEFEAFGEEGDAKIRAEKLDEGLDILTGLLTGKPFSYEGKHYHIQKMHMTPGALQSPRIPIWVGGFWPHKAPFRRAARWDGMIPLSDKGLMTPKLVRETLAFINAHREPTQPFDMAVIGDSVKHKTGKKDIARVEAIAEAGGTWWLESMYAQHNSIKELRARIRKGPPRING